MIRGRTHTTAKESEADRGDAEQRAALGREGAKAAARKRGASKGADTGAGAMTVTELRREAARLGIEGRSKMGKAQLIRAVGQKRSSS